MLASPLAWDGSLAFVRSHRTGAGLFLFEE